MGDILGIAALLGVPFAIFIYASWRRDQRDRERYRKGQVKSDPSRGDAGPYWDGMGRPGGGH